MATDDEDLNNKKETEESSSSWLDGDLLDTVSDTAQDWLSFFGIGAAATTTTATTTEPKEEPLSLTSEVVGIPVWGWLAGAIGAVWYMGRDKK